MTFNKLISIYNDTDASDIFAEYFDENGIKTDIKQGSLSDF